MEGQTLRQQLIAFIEKPKKGTGNRIKKINEGIFLVKNSIFSNSLPINYEDWVKINRISPDFEIQASAKNFYFTSTSEPNIIMYINRTLIDPSLGNEIHQDDSTKNTKYSHLFENKEGITNDEKDFTDPRLMKMRQKLIVDLYNEKITKANETISPLLILQNLKKICIMLCKDGSFAIGVYEQPACIFHKSDKKYVSRKKAGGRQVIKDKEKSIKSIGSQIRRENEKLHGENVKQILMENEKLISECDLIFIHAPSENKYILFHEESCLFQLKSKLRRICLSPKKANFTEISEIFEEITKISFLMKTANN